MNVKQLIKCLRKLPGKLPVVVVMPTREEEKSDVTEVESLYYHIDKEHRQGVKVYTGGYRITTKKDLEDMEISKKEFKKMRKAVTLW